MLEASSIWVMPAASRRARIRMVMIVTSLLPTTSRDKIRKEVIDCHGYHFYFSFVLSILSGIVGAVLALLGQHIVSKRTSETEMKKVILLLTCPQG